MRINILLECAETGERLYLTSKNKRNNPERLESKKSISLPQQEKKDKLRLTFQLLFSKLLFSFFENNVFT